MKRSFSVLSFIVLLLNVGAVSAAPVPTLDLES